MRLDAKMREDAEAIKSLGNDIARMGLEAQKPSRVGPAAVAEPPHKTASGRDRWWRILSKLRGDLFGTFHGGTLVANAIERIGKAYPRSRIAWLTQESEVAKFAVEASECERTRRPHTTFSSGQRKKAKKCIERSRRWPSADTLQIARAQTMAQALMVEGMKQTDTVAATVQAIGVLERAGPEGSAENCSE